LRRANAIRVFRGRSSEARTVIRVSGVGVRAEAQSLGRSMQRVMPGTCRIGPRALLSFECLDRSNGVAFDNRRSRTAQPS